MKKLLFIRDILKILKGNSNKKVTIKKNSSCGPSTQISQMNIYTAPVIIIDKKHLDDCEYQFRKFSKKEILNMSTAQLNRLKERNERQKKVSEYINNKLKDHVKTIEIGGDPLKGALGVDIIRM